MEKLKQISFLLLILLVTMQLHASNLAASEMIYTATGNPGEYKITLKIYRDCSGIQLCESCPTSLSANCKMTVNITGIEGAFAGISFGSADLMVVTKTSAMDIVQLCAQTRSICSNCGSRTPGSFTPGIETYTFEGLINLNNLPAGCCKVRVSFDKCCRNAALTTIQNPSATDLYNDVILDRCLAPNNSSPVFNNNAFAVVCTGADFSYSMYAIDPDGDSLSYEFGTVLSANGIDANYVNPYSKTVPFPYLGAPIQSPPALPPAGISLDPVTGELRFRPTGLFTGNIGIVIKQWRIINGKATIIGQTRRDMQITSVNCPNNNPPVLRTYDSTGILTVPQPNFSKMITYGKAFCFVVSAWDNTNAWDTTDITIEDNLLFTKEGASFQKLYDTAQRSNTGPKLDSIKICWTPSFGAVRNEPYYFKLKASDRACPIAAQTSRSFSFLVKGTSGFKQIEKADNIFTVYPNPSKELINIHLQNTYNEKLFVEMLGMDGRLIQSTYVLPGITDLNLNTNDLPSGIYIIRLNGTQFQAIQKLIIE